MLKLARWSTTHRKYVVLGWIALLLVVNVLAQSAGTSYSNNFTLPNSDAQRASDLLQHSFPTQAGDRDTIVFKVDSGTVRDPAVQAHMEAMFKEVAKKPHVAAVISPYGGTASGRSISSDGRIAFATVVFDEKANLLPKSSPEAVVKTAKAAAKPGLEVQLGGQAIEQTEQPGFGISTAVGLLAAIVVLLITFGSLTAMGLPIVTALFGLGTGLGLIALFTHVVDTPNFSSELAAMIGLGVGIDYALFILTRFREAFRTPGPTFHDVRESVLRSIDTAGRAVVFAGTTVVIALLGMMLLGVDFLYGVAISASIGVLLVMLASLTLLPALLTIAGRKVAYGSRRARRAEESAAADAVPDGSAANGSSDGAGEPLGGRTWLRWSQFVGSHATAVAIVSTAVMLAIAAPAVALRLGSSDAANDPSGQTTHKAYELLAEGFGQGFNGPLLVVAKVPNKEAVKTISTAIEGAPRVASVVPPKLNPAGNVATISVYPKSSPQAYETTQLVHDLRERVLPPIERATGAKVYVGGVTAGAVDFAAVLGHKLPLFIGVVVLLSALLLLVVFRSLVIPLQAAVMNLLSIGASLGVIVAVFQWEGWGGSLFSTSAGPIESFIPVMLFAIVFGLSMDYEVFLGLAHPRTLDDHQRQPPRRRRGPGPHRTRGDRRRRDHGVRVPLVHARRRPRDQGVRAEPGERRVPRRARDPLPAAAGDAAPARRRDLADPVVARPPAAAREHRGHTARAAGRRGQRRRRRTRGRAGRGRSGRGRVGQRRAGDGRLSRTLRRAALGLLLPALASVLAAPGASAAPRTGRAALIVFLDAGEQELATAGMSVGIMSASQGTYTPAQLQLDITQGARIASSAYPTPVPPSLSLEGNRVTGWGAVKARAAAAPQELTPGLLASSVQGGGAYAGAEGPRVSRIVPGKPPVLITGLREADRAFAVATGRGGEVAGVSFGSAATLPARIEALLGRHALVVADLGPLARGREQLRVLLAHRPPGELVLAVQRLPAGKRGQLLWLGAAGLPGTGPGSRQRKVLTSPTTQQRGLVSSVDIAPTVLGWLGIAVPGEMRGRAIEAGGTLDGAGLRRFDARLRVVGPRRLSALGFLLLAWAALLIATVAFTRAREPRARAARIGAVGIMWAPVAVMVPAALGPSAGVEYALIAALCLALGALTDLLSPWPRALIAPAVAAPVAIVLDSLAHTQLLVRSVLGPNPILGARFYGVGNELKSGLAVLVLCAVAAALYPSARHSPRRVLASVLGAGFVLALIEGSARIGAGVGGVILVCAGTAVTAVLLAPDASVRRRALLAIMAPVAGLVVLAGIDLATAHGSGHFTGSVLHARSAGDVRDIIVRRYKAAWGELHNHAMPVATALALACSGLAIRSRERLLVPVGGDQLWLAALSGGLAAGVVGSLVEDSGPVLLVVAVLALGCVLSYVWAPPAPRATSTGRT